MKMFINQPFHLVTLSPWPLLTSMTLWMFMMSFTKFLNFKLMITLQMNLFMIFLCSYQWWRDTVRESTFQGFHSNKVLEGLKMGMILFIISELFFFISFFWSYFHMFLTPSIEIGNIWPPYYMTNLMINPYNLPLLNTILLVSSGMFLSMAHYSMIKKNYKNSMMMMILTIMFGLIFTMIQMYEYYATPFNFYNSNYGCTFFMMTGFHGIHVIIGTIFIISSFSRMMTLQFSNIHHFGFEASAWYWHFVDVVWLFLFLFIYWWPF